MNLFIFRVETGTMLEFQLDMATESVQQLKIEIMKILQVPPEDQVLLVSGGISLENSAKVISYSAGTDTNPIFLFSKQSIESPYPPNASPSPNAYTGFNSKNRSTQNTTSTSDYDNYENDSGDDEPPPPTEGESSYNEFRKRVIKSRALPPIMDTVKQRAGLAQKFYEEAVRESACCQSLVHDQHLQHQGWAAAIANLEDITTEFQKRIISVQKFFGEYLDHRDNYIEFLDVYKEALVKLSKIPIIPSLLLSQFEPSRNIATIEEEELEENEESTSTNTAPQSKSKTLLEWIEARRDSKSETTMDTLYESSVRGVDIYQLELFSALYTEVQVALDTASQKDMKEIHGLSDRLFGLNSLVRNAQMQVREQEYSAESFQKTQSRAGNLGDTSVLPDLCESHRKQLIVMLKNHWKLCDIHKRCMRSKEELCNNLYQRLKWVIHVENLMRCSTDRILAYYENVLRLRFNLGVLQQIHLAPEAYMSAVIEVVRRKKFSQAFLLWASELACYMLTIYNEEVTKRKEFKSKYDNHFLMGLFPGMNDLPPSFATQAPSIFDSSLPNISIEDIEELRKAIPEMAEHLLFPDMTAITNFFLTKSMVKNDMDKVEDASCVEEKLVQVINEVGLASNLDQNLLKPAESETCLLPHGIAQLKDLDKGCESETDTEEFEKVCQSPMDLQFDKDLPSARPGYSDVTTLTEDNLQTSRSEQDKLKDLLLNMATLCRAVFVNLRQEMDEIKSKVQTDNSALELHCKSLSSSWDNLTNEFDLKEKEIHKLTQSHQNDIISYQLQLKYNNDELKSLREENSCLDSSLNKLADENKQLLDTLTTRNDNVTSKITSLEAKLLELQHEKDRSIKEAVDRMNREHKTEIDNLRKKFRFMTDRSPSDLEKSVVAGDMASAEMLRQQSYELEKQKALEELQQSENARVEKILQEKNKECQFELNRIREEAKRTMEEKDKLIQILRERETNLNLECLKHKNTLLQMTQSDMENSTTELRQYIEELKKEKQDLENMLSNERLLRMESSELSTSTSSSIAAKRTKFKENLTTSQTSLVNVARVNVETCSKGDTVLVIWKPIYKHFIVVQESDVLHFVHADCIRDLEVHTASTNEDKRIYFTALVLDKEYCQTKKSENRYNVPKGTKFYRVKIRPINIPDELLRSSHIQMTQSQTAPRTTQVPMDDSVCDSACHSLPSSPTNEEK